MKKVLVTGCNGQLGRAIQKEYAGNVTFILTDVAEGEGITSLDITDIDAVMSLVLNEKPDVIINCAAVKKCGILHTKSMRLDRATLPLLQQR